MRASPSALHPQSSRARASFHPRPALSAPACYLPAAFARPIPTDPASPLPRLSKLFASTLSLRPWRTQTLPCTQTRAPHWLVHIRQPARSRLFTHFRPRPTLPVWPPWDSPGFRITSCEPSPCFVPGLPSSPQRHSPNNSRKPKSQNPSRRQKKLLKAPHKSNCSKPASALKPTGTAAKKSTRVYTSTTNSVFANSPASISTTTAHLNRSKSLSSTSPIRAAAPPTSCPAPSPTIPTPPSSTTPPTTTSASNPSASSASSPATSSNTASSPPFRTIPSPPTSGSIIPSTAPASSPMKSSNSTSQAT